VDADLAPQLHRHGIDALSVYDVRQQGLDDPAVLAYAASQGRVLLTHNIRHFVVLHHRFLAEGRSHAGILVTNETYIGRLLTRLLTLLPTVTSDDMTNHIRFL